MFFVAAQFSDSRIQELFDVARLIVEGDYSRRAHITLRGPYKSKSDISRGIFERDPGKIILKRPGHFFEGSQNTVHMIVEMIDIADLWYKPDYPDGTPHLTIYDGSDRRFAWAVFSTLRRRNWNLILNSSRLKILDKKRTVEDDFLDSERYPALLIEKIAGRVIHAQEVRAMSQLDRLLLLDRICSRIISLTHPSSTH